MSEGVKERKKVEEQKDGEQHDKKEGVAIVEREPVGVDLEEFGEAIDTNVFKMLEDEVVRLIVESEKVGKIDYPEYIEKSWFYIRPHKNFEDKWLEMWSEILLIYCRKNRTFVVNIIDLLIDEPFRSKDGIHAITMDDLRSIIDHLVNKGKARWLDDKKERALVYWEEPEGMVSKIVRFTREAGFKYVTLHLLDKTWPDLPIEEKINLLKKLVVSKKGVWVIENYAVKLVNGA